MLCRRTTSSLVAQAPAKLNLFLRVVGKRPDGYHEIETVMTAVDLYDTLIFQASNSGRIELAVRMATQEGGRTKAEGGRLEKTERIPTGESNLVFRAASLLKQHCRVNYGVAITLIKRIPSAAGLGGGIQRCRGDVVGPQYILVARFVSPRTRRAG